MSEAAYRDYARRYGTSQSLETLLRRGGFSWAELAVFLFSELTGDTRPFDEIGGER